MEAEMEEQVSEVRETPEVLQEEPCLENAHEMRITSSGKIRSFVAFALKFLEENPARPLVLHTKPPAVTLKPESREEPAPQVLVPDSSAGEYSSKGCLKPARSRQPYDNRSWTGIPRLVSVVEIIKREYAANVQKKWREALKSSINEVPAESQELACPSTLHQYNEIGCIASHNDGTIDDDQPKDPDELRQEAILVALEGKNHLKNKRTPYMAITLCTTPLTSYMDAKMTYQPPPPPKKISKTIAKLRARVQARRNAHKLAMGAGGEGVTQHDEQLVDEEAEPSKGPNDATDGV